eukprot:3071753-Pleurochrysis_carterae.AAC.1
MAVAVPMMPPLAPPVMRRVFTTSTGVMITAASMPLSAPSTCDARGNRRWVWARVSRKGGEGGQRPGRERGCKAGAER